MSNHAVIENLLKGISVTPDGIERRTVHQDGNFQVVVMAMAGGQELPQRPAEHAGTLLVLSGNLRLTLDGEEQELSAGSWVFMEAGVPRALYARSDTVLLLTWLTAGGK